MADDLRRVGLVFKEDGAVDFKKSLQEINLELNKNYNQFKLTQAQWDKSTSSTKKLRAEQEYLKNAYEIQQDKVETLRMQLSDLENAENKNTTAIKKKRNELTSAEIKLESYNQRIKDIENQLHNTGKKIEEFGTKVEKVGNKIEGAGKKLSAFSAATAGAFVACAKSAIDFEDAFTGVEKTVDGTEEQLSELKQGILDMSKEIPSSTTEISAVAEAAGQLGIKTEDILSFTRVMIDLGNSTNLSAEEAASSLAKFANITNMSAKDYDKLGSVIVDLGNNFATTEADIVSMSTRLAATGELTGLTEAQIMALATAMSSVGIEAEAGGSAMSKLLKQIQVAVETGTKDYNNLESHIKKYGYSMSDLNGAINKGGKTLENFSKKVGMNSKELKAWHKRATNSLSSLEQFSNVAGMTAEEFQKAFQEDALKALSAFISGLNDTERNGASAIAILEDMDIKEVRLSNTILSLANSSELMNRAIDSANKAWEDNDALTNEANKRYETLKSQIQTTINKLKVLAISIGNKLTPIIPKVTKQIEKLTKWVDKLDDSQIEWILSIGKAVIAIGPLITAIGKVTTTTGKTIKGIGTFVQALDVASGTATSTSIAVNSLAKVIAGIVSPVGMACTLVGLAIAGIAISAQNTTKQTKEAFSNIGNAANDFIEGIKTANSHLEKFNSTLFVSSEEQQKLEEQMNDVQKGITNICKTASDERRGYTQEEITQLDEYFQRLRELNQREIEIQQSIASAITQQATTTAETLQGTSEEYKVQAQEWIKTAQEQKDKTVTLIEQQTIEEVALLNQRFGNEADMQNEAYANEYNKIMENKETKIDLANDEVAKISQVYANGYMERSNQESQWYSTLQEYSQKIENENKRNADALESIQNNVLLTQSNKNSAKQNEEYRHEKEMAKIWNKMYKDMDESQEEQLGVWLAQVQQTELYGGQIDDKTRSIVDSIIASYDSMPDGTRKAMKNAMSPLYEEMEKSEPSLFAKAKGIGEGIISRLKKAFDEHSPSKLTRKIMRFAMEPMEDEMETGKKELFKQADEIGNGITDRLNNIDGNVDMNEKQTSGKVFNTDYNKLAESIAILTNDTNRKIIELLTKILERSGQQIVLDTGAVVGGIVDKVDVALGDVQVRKERGS